MGLLRIPGDKKNKKTIYILCLAVGKRLAI